MTRAELIEALESAKGPDATLDCWIENLLGIARYERAGGFGDFDHQRLEPYALTKSLDSAIALVERVRPGSDWIVGRGKLTPEEPLYGAQILSPDGTAHDVIGEGEHDATPAIALIIALLESEGE